MRMMRAAIVFLVAVAAGSAWGFGAGGTAPGGPLSGGIRPACNGYDMAGRATGGACDGRSVDERRADTRRDERAR